jgi:hypothetical protein
MSRDLEGPITASEFSEPQDAGGTFLRHQRWPSRQENLVAAERRFFGGLRDPLPQLSSLPLDRFHNDDGVNAELGEQQRQHPLTGLNAGIRDPAAFAGSDLDQAEPL